MRRANLPFLCVSVFRSFRTPLSMGSILPTLQLRSFLPCYGGAYHHHHHRRRRRRRRHHRHHLYLRGNEELLSVLEAFSVLVSLVFGVFCDHVIQLQIQLEE